MKLDTVRVVIPVDRRDMLHPRLPDHALGPVDFLLPLKGDGDNGPSSVARLDDPATRMRFEFYSSRSRDVVDQHRRRFKNFDYMSHCFYFDVKFWLKNLFFKS